MQAARAIEGASAPLLRRGVGHNGVRIRPRAIGSGCQSRPAAIAIRPLAIPSQSFRIGRKSLFKCHRVG